MSERRIAVSLSKGGTGKSTTLTSLAHGLALAGHTVLAIDTDTQGQVAEILGCQPEVGLSELVAEEVSPDDALFNARENLWILAGGRQLAATKQLIAKQEFGSEQVLTRALEPYADRFDYILIDTSPGWDALTINVLFYVNELIAPVALEVLAVRGLIHFENRIADIQSYRQDLNLRYVLPTFLDGRVRQSEEIMKQLEIHYQDRMCRPIRYNVRLSEAPGHGMTIFEYAPRSSGAADYAALVERIRSDG